MKRAALAILLLAALPLRADFDTVAGALLRKPGVTRQWIPGLGIARAAVFIARPSGVHDFQLAVFHGVGRDADIIALMRQHAGREFRPLVVVRERRESSAIYAHVISDAVIEILILTNDGEETTLVRTVLDADEVARQDWYRSNVCRRHDSGPSARRAG